MVPVKPEKSKLEQYVFLGPMIFRAHYFSMFMKSSSTVIKYSDSTGVVLCFSFLRFETFYLRAEWAEFEESSHLRSLVSGRGVEHSKLFSETTNNYRDERPRESGRIISVSIQTRFY